MNEDDIDDLRKRHRSIGVGRGVRPAPEHGTYARVVSKKYPCQPLCDPCREASRIYRARWRNTGAGRAARKRETARRAASREADVTFKPDIRRYWREVKAMTESQQKDHE